jgi:hypothetical protein
MKDAPRQRHLGVIGVGIVLVISAAWWLFLSPNSNWMRRYSAERDIKSKLESFKPPAGVTRSDISTYTVNGEIVTKATYSIDSDFESVKTHYNQELVADGFSVMFDQGSFNKQAVLFCGPGYEAYLSSLAPTERPLPYVLILKQRARPC